MTLCDHEGARVDGGIMGFVTCMSFVVSQGGFQTQSAACQQSFPSPSLGFLPRQVVVIIRPPLAQRT